MVYCGALARVEEKEYMNNCMICLICLIVTQVHPANIIVTFYPFLGAIISIGNVTL